MARRPSVTWLRTQGQRTHRQRYWLALGLLAAQLAANAQTYQFDSKHCIPEFEFTHLGLTHQSGRFDNIEGQVTLDRAAHQGSVLFDIDAASLNMGFGTETPDSAGFRMLRVREFTHIRFQSQQLFFNDQDQVIAATGQLTLLGVSRPLTVWVHNFRCARHPLTRTEVCAGAIQATVIRSDFGLLDFIPAISDAIQVNVPVEAFRLAPGTTDADPARP